MMLETVTGAAIGILRLYVAVRWLWPKQKCKKQINPSVEVQLNRCGANRRRAAAHARLGRIEIWSIAKLDPHAISPAAELQGVIKNIV